MELAHTGTTPPRMRDEKTVRIKSDTVPTVETIPSNICRLWHGLGFQPD